MLDELERPDGHFDCLQVAGTNGKTSTARFCAAILAGEGLTSALYTSPQLVRYPERMEIAGRVVSDEAFAHGVSAARAAGARVNARRRASGHGAYAITPFDLLTVAALVIFAEAGVDVAVLEVGMGGRWDATSATDPVAVAITGIGLDHMRILGDTLAAIAGEKAAVIKPGRAVTLGAGTHEPSVQQVMDARCRACGVVPAVANHVVLERPARLGEAFRFSTTTRRAIYTPALRKPVYQAQNAACAIQLAEDYLGRPLDESALEASLAACPTPGRFDVVARDPLVLVDACHNPQSCAAFTASLGELAPSRDERPTLLVAALTDKDVAGIVDVLVPAFPRVAVTQTASGPRHAGRRARGARGRQARLARAGRVRARRRLRHRFRGARRAPGGGGARDRGRHHHARRRGGGDSARLAGCLQGFLRSSSPGASDASAVVSPGAGPSDVACATMTSSSLVQEVHHAAARPHAPPRRTLGCRACHRRLPACAARPDRAHQRPAGRARRACGPSTVVRFCQRFGFAGYDDFRAQFLAEMRYIVSHFDHVDPNYPFSFGERRE